MQLPKTTPGAQCISRGPNLFPSHVLGLLLFLIPLFFNLTVRAQDAGTVSGVVVSTWDGTPLVGVTVTVRGTTLAVQTGADGRYELKNVPPGDQVLRFSRSGFAAAAVTDVHVLVGQATTVNGNLRPEFYEMEEYEVTAEEFSEQTEKILIERQNSTVMMEALGSDFLARVGAGNAAESISKISGATISEGKFAVIRGLNDRYVTTTLNGGTIPSADPYRQTASLDLFPAQVIDRVVVSKTFTPDQPGTFTGGGIDIVTKSFHEKPFVSTTLGLQHNTQSTFNDNFLTYKGGGLDWAGMDDGSRALPDVNIPAPIPAVPTGAGGRTNSALFLRGLTNSAIVDKITKAFGTTEFAPHHEAPPLDHNFSIAGGGSIPAPGGTFGYFAGGSYKHEYFFYEDGVSRRYEAGPDRTTVVKSDYDDTRSLSTVNWAGMVNLAYRLFEDHELDFTFFYNQNAIDDARIQDNGFEASSEQYVFRKFNLYWTERNLNTYQLRGEHRFPDIVQFNWLVALTQTTQDEPDARFFNDWAPRDGGDFSVGNPAPLPQQPTRYFRNLDEHNLNLKLDWAIPFESWTEDEGRFKFGLFGSHTDRSFTDHAYWYAGPAGGYNNDPNQFLTEQNLGLDHITTNRFGNTTFFWDRYIQSFDSLYDGALDIKAAYAMLEFPVLDHLRLVGGIRVETTDLSVHSESYRPSSITGVSTNNTHLNQAVPLPSIGLIFEVITNMNIRLNYSQTIARPSFRELAAYFSYDPVINDFVEGNPLLVMTSIDNYDVRWEWFPRPGQLYSISIFYKDLQNAIERGDLKLEGDTITWKNRDEAQIYGIEFEARRSLDFIEPHMAPFSIGGNLSLVESTTELTKEEFDGKKDRVANASKTRPLYDQSPYIVNVDLSYLNLRSGTTASIVYNMAGPRIVITKLNTDDVYEQPVPILDFILSQRVGKHATVKFTAKNLLNPNIERTYGKDSDLLYSSYTKGRTFGLALTYDF